MWEYAQYNISFIYVYKFTHLYTFDLLSPLLWIMLLWTWGYLVSVWVSCFQFFWMYTWRGVAGSYGNFIFNIWKKAPQCFPQWLRYFIYFCQKWTRIPVSPHPHRCLLFMGCYCCFFIITILVGGFDLHFPHCWCC